MEYRNEQNARNVIRARRALIDAITDRTELEQITSKIIFMQFLARCGEKEIQMRKLRLRDWALAYKQAEMEKAIDQTEPFEMLALQEKVDRLTEKPAQEIAMMETLWKKSMRQYRVEKRMGAQRQENKRMYREIVAKMSPDVFPDGGKQRALWFEEATRAYGTGDIARLKKIYESSRKLRRLPVRGDAAQQEEEVLRLEERTREMEVWTAFARSCPPFQYEELVKDESAIEQYIRDTEEKIEGYQKSIIRRQTAMRRMEEKLARRF